MHSTEDGLSLVITRSVQHDLMADELLVKCASAETCSWMHRSWRHVKLIEYSSTFQSSLLVQDEAHDLLRRRHYL